MENEVLEIMEWWSTYKDKNLLIQSENHSFKVEINEEQLPHLLGLQYMNITLDKRKIKGKELYEYTVKNKLSNKKIMNLVKNNNPEKVEDVKERIKNFVYFFENIKKGNIVENTNEISKINSDKFIVLNRNNKILHLGLKKENGKEILEFEVENISGKIQNMVMETFFKRKDNIYYKDSLLVEKVEKIYELKNDKLVKFAFKFNRNKEKER